MTEWNDGRLDDLGKRVNRIEKKMDDGFVHLDQKIERLDERMGEEFIRVDQKMDAGFARVDRKMEEGFARMEAKFDGLHRVLFQAACGFAIAMIGLIGVIVTKL